MILALKESSCNDALPGLHGCNLEAILWGVGSLETPSFEECLKNGLLRRLLDCWLLYPNRFNMTTQKCVVVQDMPASKIGFLSLTKTILMM